MMRTIYLDQMHWIQLSRAYHGRSTDPTLRAVLDFVLAARDTGQARFPLSMAHYVETAKRGDVASRVRLAKVQRELSAGLRFAPPERIVAHELDVALRLEFGGRVEDRYPFALVERGVGQLTGVPAAFRLVGPDLASIPRERIAAIEDEANELLDEVMLTGVSPVPTRTVPPRWFEEMGVPAERFKDGLTKLAGQYQKMDATTRLRAIYAETMVDIRTDLNDALVAHGISWDEFAMLGIDGWMRFLNNMPSRRVNMHLRRQWVQNSSLPATVTDLNDWEYVGTAVAYCDVVVTERQLANLVNRPELDKKAVVIADLTKLPAA